MSIRENNEQPIDRFREEYGFLSNFYIVPITYNGITYHNSEAAFQAQKCVERAEEFAHVPGNYAKWLGKRVNLRPDWNDVRIDIMHDVVLAKFTQNEDIREKLLATGNRELIEGNTWRDYFWGVCNGRGENHLGKILMQVREEVKNISK